ncbi:MAG: SpoIIE family protein phosphatase, partial [Candidatus Eisenbacteria bacterium]|nr:SpoIIE family protein phosphatase [Candidatus Eisenbacteria bacterium]
MERLPLLRLARWLFAALAAGTLAGQILELERAAEIPRASMTLRDSRVVVVLPGGAAERAGLLPGDRILAVGGEPLSRGGEALPLLQRLAPGREATLLVRRGGETRELPYRPDPPQRGDILWRFAVGGVGIVTLLIGVVVFLKNPRPLTFTFGAICYAMGALVQPPFVPWLTGLLVARKALLMAATLFVPPLLVHLFLAFPLRHPWLDRRGRRVGLLYAPSLALLALALWALARIPPDAADPLGPASLLGPSATILWIAGVGAAITLFAVAYRRARSRASRGRVRAILWGTILGTLPIAAMLAVRAVRPALAIPGDRLAVLAVILIPLSFGYAIVRHGIFDLSLLVRRSLALSLLAALLACLYFVLQMALGELLPGLAAASPLWLPFLSLCAVGLLLPPTYRGLERLLESRAGAGRPRDELIYEFGVALRGMLGRGPLVRLISESVAEALGASRVACFEPARGGGLRAAYLCGVPPEALAPWPLSAALVQRLRSHARPLDRGELDTELPFGYLSPADQAALDALDAHLLVPLRAGEQFRGCLLVGRPAYGESFTAADRRLAETLAAEGSLALENSLLHERAMEEERLRGDVELARDLQERLLPTRMPQLDSLEAAGFSVPCQGVGGDYYDCFLTPRGELLLAIGDVSGKGVPGAILMANLQGLVKVEGVRDEPPARIVERINRQICEMEKPERFVTFCLARVDPRGGEVTYCNAGHPSMLLARGDGTIEELSVGGLPLGIRADAAYDGAAARLGAGDLLLLYTDGVTERTRPGGEQFGAER